MRKILSILILCAVGLVGLKPDYNSESGPENNTKGFINITVLSNIGKQFFKYSINQQCFSLTGKQETGYSKNNTISSMIIPVKDFRCINKSAYNDFLSLLKVNHYPNLEIDLPYNPIFKYSAENQVMLKGVSFNIAGVTKQYDILCKIDGSGTENQFLIGTTRIKLTDFQIVPPAKFFGLIKVADEIVIDFEFCLQYKMKGMLLKA